MVQTALLVFLENGERPLPYAYVCAQTALQKGRRVGGRIGTRQVHLGPVGSLTKEKLWAKSLELERRLAGFLEEATGNLGRINESRQVMFGVI